MKNDFDIFCLDVFPRFYLEVEPADLVLTGSRSALDCVAVGQPAPTIR